MADYKKYILSTDTHYISNSGSDENGKALETSFKITVERDE